MIYFVAIAYKSALAFLGKFDVNDISPQWKIAGRQFINIITRDDNVLTSRQKQI